MHAPVLDYLLSTLRAHRAAGTAHPEAALDMEAYILHVIRLADQRALSGAEALVAANRAMNAALGLPSLQDARHEPR
ncbi:hypothetical protein [Methylobacterium frigidaeris]|uniref:Uncharacterized protein n=1 Tax=Methylobacterium frigidaeris TaxID=2038277 RepID=A0AA37HIM0_9HYPH|nr:hypothetical protein [Methylobacterium frigidaeris]PIK72682.1 hypothetical protein CS379_12615 [Methylobacterium frigidaeris]GJD66482.1 hypothetical protein MPEAHAMD_6680 [Methylobacterium frigidaeris]